LRRTVAQRNPPTIRFDGRLVRTSVIWVIGQIRCKRTATR
jgi:hypothetical protein